MDFWNIPQNDLKWGFVGSGVRGCVEHVLG